MVSFPVLNISDSHNTHQVSPRDAQLVKIYEGNLTFSNIQDENGDRETGVFKNFNKNMKSYSTKYTPDRDRLAYFANINDIPNIIVVLNYKELFQQTNQPFGSFDVVLTRREHNYNSGISGDTPNYFYDGYYHYHIHSSQDILIKLTLEFKGQKVDKHSLVKYSIDLIYGESENTIYPVGITSISKIYVPNIVNTK